MIYLDNAATTSIHPSVFARMRPLLEQHHGNPSSTHGIGRFARHAIQVAREQIAHFLGANPNQLIFTSGGTEANHSALFGAWLYAKSEVRPHFISTAIEHHAVLHTLEFLKTLGADVTLIPVNRHGIVDVRALVNAVRPSTVCVSVMAVNNEIGTIQPLDELAARVKEKKANILLHTDMIQALPFERLNLNQRLIDLATLSAHKIHGPKGVGLLYLKEKTNWTPVLYGGAQEHKRRAGTENVAGIVGFGAAVEELATHFEERIQHIKRMQAMLKECLSTVPHIEFISPDIASGIAAPTILSVRFPGVSNDVLLMRLDLEGVAASAGSACTAGSIEPSHVLQACQLSATEIREVVRFSFSADTTESDILQATETIRQVVATLRQSRGKSLG